MIIRVAALYATISIIAILVVGALGSGVWGIAVGCAITIVGVTVVTVALTRARSRQIASATQTANAFAAGHFGERAALDDDMQPLAHAMNRAGEHAEKVITDLRQAQAQLEALLNASNDATVAVDRAGTVVYLNKAAMEMFPTAGADFGYSFIELVRDHDLNDLMFNAVRNSESNVRVVAYGASQRWIQATAVPIPAAGNWAALAVFHDLTEVRRIESMRRDFISNVSHELRTPLAGIRAAAETLQEGGVDDEVVAREFAANIVRETDRLTEMVEELLELSRIESGAARLHLEAIDVAALVMGASQRFIQQAERAHLTLRCEVAEPDLRLAGDSEQLERALSNLIVNAIKFTPAGGEICVSAAADNDAVKLVVRDNGVGIEPAERERVFERFYKADRARHSSGVGLGLAIVKHIAQAHGGSVSVESRPGRGSTFAIRVPRGNAAAA